MKNLGRLHNSIAVIFSLPFLFASVYALDVNVDCATIVRTLPASFHGLNYCTFWDGQIGKDPSNQALRRLGVQLLRYPGGEPANWLDWSANPTTDVNSVTLDQLGPQAAFIGGRILYQTNPTTDTVHKNPLIINDPSAQHQKDLVNYCKSHAIDVALWEIGNEPDMSGNFSAIQWYYDRFNEQADAIHSADPNAIVMGPGVFSALGDSGWIKTFEDKCGTRANALSLHWYPTGNNGWTDTLMLGQAQEWMTKAWPMISALTKKPVYITEWSTDKHPDWYHVGLKIYMSVAHADIIGAFAKSGVAGHAMFGSIHCITDNWGILASGGCGDGWVNGTLSPGTLPAETPAPDYFMFHLWTKMGNKVLNATHSANPRTVFNAWAHKRDNGSVQVMLINKDSIPQPITVKFTGFDPTGLHVYIYEMYKAKNFAWDRLDSVVFNGQPHPFPATNDLPPPIDGGICPGATFSRTIPALSISVLDFVDPNAQAIGSRMISPKNNRLIISGKSGTRIQITCPDAAVTSCVQIFRADGKMIDNLDMKSGIAFWSTADKPAGLYYVKMNSGANSQARAVSISR